MKILSECALLQPVLPPQAGAGAMAARRVAATMRTLATIGAGASGQQAVIARARLTQQHLQLLLAASVARLEPVIVGGSQAAPQQQTRTAAMQHGEVTLRLSKHSLHTSQWPRTLATHLRVERPAMSVRVHQAAAPAALSAASGMQMARPSCKLRLQLMQAAAILQQAVHLDQAPSDVAMSVRVPAATTKGGVQQLGSQHQCAQLSQRLRWSMLAAWATTLAMQPCGRVSLLQWTLDAAAGTCRTMPRAHHHQRHRRAVAAALVLCPLKHLLVLHPCEGRG